MYEMSYKQFIALRNARMKRLTEQQEEMKRDTERREREARINQIMGKN
nr:MAG TPA: hypothetical protein [Caudoviricetes sp.]